eukprot:724568-Ditylum_brightwellii.AAC.1
MAEDSKDEGVIEIDEAKVYTPINPNVAPMEKRVYNLRSQKEKETEEEGKYDMSQDNFNDVVHFALTQYSLKEGLKKFKKEGEDAVKEEFQQLHQKETFTPMAPQDLTHEQKKIALNSLMFITKKGCGRVKARQCMNGCKQRNMYSKEEAASPMVSTKAILLISIIDAKEGQDVATTDIPVAYLNADMDDKVIMVMEGQLAELIVQTVPELYQKYLGVRKNNKPILYIKLCKALYGCLKSALLFYNKLMGDLQDLGFEVNPYDPCVANKMVRGKQMTICWHVDDLKISHVNSREVTKMLKILENKYRKMKTTRGKVHDYLGMTLDYRKKA